jgi:hypothetical protein
MKKILFSISMLFSAAWVHSTVFVFDVSLDGPSEPSPSLGIGNGTVTYDDIAHTLQLDVSFSGLTGITTVSHIHAPTLDPLTGTAGVATTTPTLPSFPAGVTSGTYSMSLDLTSASSYNPAFVTANGGTTAGAEAALAAAMLAEKAYWNIHSSDFPGGEIRGFLVPVPEPSTTASAGVVAVGLILFAWKRRRMRTA